MEEPDSGIVEDEEEDDDKAAEEEEDDEVDARQDEDSQEPVEASDEAPRRSASLDVRSSHPSAWPRKETRSVSAMDWKQAAAECQEKYAHLTSLLASPSPTARKTVQAGKSSTRTNGFMYERTKR